MRGDLEGNIEAAIRHYRRALEVATEATDPYAWAEHHNNLGNAYERRTKGRRQDNIRAAIEHYQLALRVRTPEALPAEAVATLHNLGQLLFHEERWAEAAEPLARAIDAGEDLLASSYTEAGREARVGETSTLYALAAYCALRLGKPEEALARLEQGKGRLLAEALTTRDVEAALLEPDQRTVLEDARRRIRSLEREMRLPADVPGTRDTAEIGEALKDARGALRRVMTSIRSDHPDLEPAALDVPSVLGLVPAEGALVAPVVTHRRSAAFVIPGRTRTVTADHIVRLDDLSLDVLMVGTDEEPGWVYLYLSLANRAVGEAAWEQAVQSYTAWLWTALMGPIHDRLVGLGVAKGAPVVLIPQGNLAALPLGAAWREADGSAQTFLDDFTVSYAPSAYSLSVARRRLVEGARRPTSLLTVIDPTADLPFTRVEAKQVAASCPQPPVVLAGSQTTLAAVLEATHEKTHVHFACHGFYDWNEPMMSSLSLAGGDPLSLARIVSDLDLDAARLVVLSACETGLVDFRGARDEYVGLAAGFIMAGSPGVLVSLWRVDDVSTALLLGAFYRHHLGAGLGPAEALREAQRWLRTATTSDLGLAHLYRGLWEESGEQDPVTFRGWRYYRERPDEVPFAHPYHWAGFVFAGA